jgi:hypothetical protein
MKIPDKARWTQEWTPKQVKRVSEIAAGLRTRGAPNDLSAWRLAEDKLRQELKGSGYSRRFQ